MSNKTLITVGKNETKTILITRSGTYCVELVGEGAKAILLGVFRGEKDEVFTIHTLQHHKAPRTTSDLLIKSVLGGRSTLHYDGLIKIEKSAQQSNAYQRNENLLLTDSAAVESKPELEILANDVRCTHGATIGIIDEEELFYLQTRGIDKSTAETMIIDGFLRGVLSKINNNDERNKISKQLGFGVDEM